MIMSWRGIFSFDAKQNKLNEFVLSNDAKRTIDRLYVVYSEICYNPVTKQLHLLSMRKRALNIH